MDVYEYMDVDVDEYMDEYEYVDVGEYMEVNVHVDEYVDEYVDVVRIRTADKVVKQAFPA